VRPEWVIVLVAAVSLPCGWLVGWLPRRRLGTRYLEDVNRAELKAARLRGELDAALANAAEARNEAAATQAALAEALLERGRLHQRVEELAGSSVSVADHRAALERVEQLRAEVVALQQQLALLAPVTDELHHYRDYVESLQRELLYRDERLLAIEAAHPETRIAPASAAVIEIEAPAVAALPVAPASALFGAVRAAAPAAPEDAGIEDCTEDCVTEPLASAG